MKASESRQHRQGTRKTALSSLCHDNGCLHETSQTQLHTHLGPTPPTPSCSYAPTPHTHRRSQRSEVAQELPPRHAHQPEAEPADEAHDDAVLEHIRDAGVAAAAEDGGLA